MLYESNGRENILACADCVAYLVDDCGGYDALTIAVFPDELMFYSASGELVTLPITGDVRKRKMRAKLCAHAECVDVNASHVEFSYDWL